MFYNLQCKSCFRNKNYNNLRNFLLGHVDNLKIEAVFDIGEYDGEVYCECKKPVKKGDLYIYCDRFEEISIRLIAENISKKVEFCSKCEGEKMNSLLDEYVELLEPAKGIDEIEDYLFDLGTEVKHLFDYPIGNYKLENKIIKHLNCQNCGAGYDSISIGNPYYDSLKPDDKAYTKAEVDSFYRNIDFNKINSFAKYYGIRLSITELEEFVNFIQDFPLLAFKHNVGQKIYEMLESHFRSPNAGTIVPPWTLFRGRVKHKLSKPFSTDEMWEPPKGVASHGRYNTVGSSVLYCCTDINFIPYEIYPNNYQNLCIAKVKVNKGLKILNIQQLFNKFNGFVGESSDYIGIYNSNYSLTNYIAECSRNIGYKGVQYAGVKGGKYKNFAFFNYTKGEDLIINEVTTIDLDIQYSISKELTSKLEV
ncbi:RES domain-containing protein [Peribacillus frigoritolerans]|uniref:RES domain-containing protein n=1 Tax=Peribacillus frigoritolerans TaxID=450367 RepID=UPI0020BF8997|nr:RES domain-containing protein [Peribacillus frigoritolerans]MEE3951642.1 RES domain-containing protein [Peribacillus frigoritolerans]